MYDSTSSLMEDGWLQVAPGSDCSFPQKVMAINIRNKECCEVGDVNKRAVVTPDIDFLLNSPLD